MLFGSLEYLLFEIVARHVQRHNEQAKTSEAINRFTQDEIYISIIENSDLEEIFQGGILAYKKKVKTADGEEKTKDIKFREIMSKPTFF